MELVFGILTFLVVNVPRVNMFSHGRTRTRTLSPTGNLRLSFLGKQMQHIPPLLDLTSKHKPLERTHQHSVRKRFFSFNPVIYGTHSDESPFEISAKRFFGIPFYGQIASHHRKKTASDMSFKSALIGKGTKAKVTPYVDHFSGVKAWALPFYKSKDEHNPTEVRLNDNTASNTNTKTNDTEYSKHLAKEISSDFSTAALQSVATPETETLEQRRKDELKAMENLIEESIPEFHERSHWEESVYPAVNSDSSDLINKLDTALQTPRTYTQLHGRTSNAYLKLLEPTVTDLELLENSKANLERLESMRNPDPLPSGKLSKLYSPLSHDGFMSDTANPFREPSFASLSLQPIKHQFSDVANSGFNGNDEESGVLMVDTDMGSDDNFGKFAPNGVGHYSFPDTTAPAWNNSNGDSNDGFGDYMEPDMGFSIDESDCQGIEGNPCVEDKDCGCEGFYFCDTEASSCISIFSIGPEEFGDFDDALATDSQIYSPEEIELGFQRRGHEWLESPVDVETGRF